MVPKCPLFGGSTVYIAHITAKIDGGTTVFTPGPGSSGGVDTTAVVLGVVIGVVVLLVIITVILILVVLLCRTAHEKKSFE